MPILFTSNHDMAWGGGAAQLQLPRPRVHYIMKRNSCNDTEILKSSSNNKSPMAVIRSFLSLNIYLRRMRKVYNCGRWRHHQLVTHLKFTRASSPRRGGESKKRKKENSNFLMNEVTSNKSHAHTKNIAHLNILVYTVPYYNGGGGIEKRPISLTKKIK